ncbi:hypothetical protein H072_5312 [Dactylellina haptotyla CBS 200.50]|uniref:Uncharacterized protein n=1 Tax=Dactylellina haptotyla (strain CBS 200.50) TaxID=1284197 RepID=S8BZI2_DACHA|nr:hypothetical protein H072_5312 [Dactylellina haptotyla CBS 200.50]
MLAVFVFFLFSISFLDIRVHAETEFGPNDQPVVSTLIVLDSPKGDAVYKNGRYLNATISFKKDNKMYCLKDSSPAQEYIQLEECNPTDISQKWNIEWQLSWQNHRNVKDTARLNVWWVNSVRTNQCIRPEITPEYTTNTTDEYRALGFLRIVDCGDRAYDNVDRRFSMSLNPDLDYMKNIIGHLAPRAPSNSGIGGQSSKYHCEDPSIESLLVPRVPGPEETRAAFGCTKVRQDDANNYYGRVDGPIWEEAIAAIDADITRCRDAVNKHKDWRAANSLLLHWKSCQKPSPPLFSKGWHDPKLKCDEVPEEMPPAPVPVEEPPAQAPVSYVDTLLPGGKKYCLKDPQLNQTWDYATMETCNDGDPLQKWTPVGMVGNKNFRSYDPVEPNRLVYLGLLQNAVTGRCISSQYSKSRNGFEFPLANGSTAWGFQVFGYNTVEACDGSHADQRMLFEPLTDGDPNWRLWPRVPKDWDPALMEPVAQGINGQPPEYVIKANCTRGQLSLLVPSDESFSLLSKSPNPYHYSYFGCIDRSIALNDAAFAVMDPSPIPDYTDQIYKSKLANNGVFCNIQRNNQISALTKETDAYNDENKKFDAYCDALKCLQLFSDPISAWLNKDKTCKDARRPEPVPEPKLPMPNVDPGVLYDCPGGGEAPYAPPDIYTRTCMSLPTA